jgi:cytochrome P450
VEAARAHTAVDPELKAIAKGTLLRLTEEALEKGGKGLSDLMHGHHKISTERLAEELLGTLIAGVGVPTSALCQFALFAYPSNGDFFEFDKNPAFWELLNLVDRAPNLESFLHSKEVDNFFKEMMRFTSPDTDGFPKAIAKAMTIDGISYEAGQVFLVSPYVMHHNPTVFEKPEEFITSRWNKNYPVGAYIAYHLGMHKCTGEDLARLIILVTLYVIHTMSYLGIQDRSTPKKWELAPSFPKGVWVIIAERRLARNIFP